ncbi:PRC-barrel domain-containing protein [Sabulicella glaciei]|uniref:PRC-barrel domain-containing protein n=1 Tax=Sabulicella glaciei TaxID=2984948 RepID=A0ABT3P1N1_9PROT|nr:PRC-barrel domain-containing protein [Roseococcus sp. MDT2-1-1]MCW8088312.1 PRC-barrel domain-containing protein [Roseococcus sp. MDT2-1-1]
MTRQHTNNCLREMAIPLAYLGRPLLLAGAAMLAMGVLTSASAQSSGGSQPAQTHAQTGGAGGAAGSGAQITVQQPAPQITVQQPAPQVTVQQPAPQVTVRQPEPQVTVQQPQPQVNVQQAQPQVNVQQPGQPQVTVQQPGQPQANAPRPGTQTTPATQTTGVDLQSVQSLVGKNVYGPSGREAGEVRNLLIDRSGRVRAAVIEWGGFLGIGERQALVPIERIQLGASQSDRAQLNMTRDELEALPRYDNDRIAEYGRERGWGEGLRLFR